MPSAGLRHERAVSATVRWILRPIEKLTHDFEKQEDNLSQKDRKALEWCELLENCGAAEISLPETLHCPDASLGSVTNGVRPLVLEVADSQSSQGLACLAADYLNLGKGLIKYMFAVDIRETADGADVDLIIWKHIKLGEDVHSNERWAMHVSY